MFSSNTESEIDDYQFPLPGFRFHPTDEELVGFYLRQKIKNKAIGTELIKPIDIYKHNPWDLSNAGNNLGEKEWYFFCKRGRKYKNSIRPNRVTGCGFWKATGIDKPIYSHGNQCIGLKKTLVFYKGNAGKGTKTEWMMHEFRLPSHSHSSFFGNLTNNVQQAEIWTLCRIFKRSVTCTKYAPNWRDEIAAAKGHLVFGETNSNTNSDTMDKSYDRENTFISFSSSFISFDEKKKHVETNQWSPLMMDFSSISELPSPSSTNESLPSTTTTSSSFSNFDGDETDLFGYKNKEMLKSISHFALDSCYDVFGCEQIHIN